MIPNVYAPNHSASKLVRKKIARGNKQIYLIVGNFTILFSVTYWSRRHISKDIVYQSMAIYQLDLIETYKTLHSTKTDNTFFQSHMKNSSP